MLPERLLVCVGPSPASADVIRAARSMAARLKAAWYAVYVEDPKMLRLSEAERNRAIYNLRLAEQLGAETVTLRGRRIAEEIVSFARQRQITRIVAGKPTSPRWKTIFSESPVDELMRGSGGIDIYAITGEPAEQKETPVLVQPRPLHLGNYEMALMYLALASGLAFLMYPYFDLPNLIMVYLLGVMATAIQCGRGPAILNSLLSVQAFNFFFVPPRWTFTVQEVKYIVTFAVMFLTAVVISYFATLIRRQAEAARLQERQTAAMHALSGELAGTRGVENILQVSLKHFADIFQCDVVALLPDESGKLYLAAGDLTSVFHHDFLREMGLVQEAFDTGQMAGWGTQTKPDSPILSLPLKAADSTLGVLALRPKDPQSESWLLPEQLRYRLLESLTKQVALALEVERLQKSALESQVVMQTERLRSSLLGSVTHDFQTPLAAIMGSASSLLDLQGKINSVQTQEMLANIYDEAERLSRLVNNLLNIARLQAGALKLHKELQPLEEVVGAALNRLEKKFANRPITTSLPADLPMVPLDASLAEQIFINLLENSLKYTPSGSSLAITAVHKNDEIEVEVADLGPGFPANDLENVFEMYYRGTGDIGQKGYGLGLSICRAIVQAHGGRIWAVNRPGGGASIYFTFPLKSED